MIIQRAIVGLNQPSFRTIGRSLSSASLGCVRRYPTSDMVETPDDYELSAELPGYTKSNIKIEITDCYTLVLRSDSKNKQWETKSPESKQYTMQQSVYNYGNDKQLDEKFMARQGWVKERVFGSFSRTFSFPTSINPNTVKAKFENGVLKVTLPKVSKSEAKQSQKKKKHIQARK